MTQGTQAKPNGKASPDKSYKLRSGAEPHQFTPEDRRKGALRSAEVRREKAKTHAQRVRDEIEKHEKAMVKALVDKVKEGNVQAAQTLWAYAYGTPAKVEPEELDVTMRSEDGPRGTNLAALVAKAQELGIDVPDGARVSNPD